MLWKASLWSVGLCRFCPRLTSLHTEGWDRTPRLLPLEEQHWSLNTEIGAQDPGPIPTSKRLALILRPEGSTNLMIICCLIYYYSRENPWRRVLLSPFCNPPTPPFYAGLCTSEYSEVSGKPMRHTLCVCSCWSDMQTSPQKSELPAWGILLGRYRTRI